MSARKMIMMISHDATDTEIRSMIRDYDRLLRATGDEQGYTLTVYGFDADRRELYEIPEAVSLLRRFVRFGGLGLLALSPLDTGLPSHVLPPQPCGIGAVEVWAVAKRRVRGMELSIDWREFRRDYEESLRLYHDLVA